VYKTICNQLKKERNAQTKVANKKKQANEQIKQNIWKNKE
jgi:hypothetical protein